MIWSSANVSGLTNGDMHDANVLPGHASLE
jgi:hypothetical protein